MLGLINKTTLSYILVYMYYKKVYKLDYMYNVQCINIVSSDSAGMVHAETLKPVPERLKPTDSIGIPSPNSLVKFHVG